MNILIVGYPYIRQNFLNTFKYYPYPGEIYFLLPKTWKAKGGKVVFKSPQGQNVFKTKAFFSHSRYPVIGGLLKGWMPFFPFFLFKKIKKFEILYSPSEPILLTTLYQGVWAKIFGLKHVIFTWENISYDLKLKGFKGAVQRIILRLNLAFCDGVICGNKKAQEIFSRLTRKPLAKIPLSGVDPQFFKPLNKGESKKAYNLEGKLVFIFVGAIGYRKGIHLIIEVFKDLTVEIPNAHLIIAGSGEYEKEIAGLIKNYDLEKFITKIPWVKHEELPGILSASEIFLYPSLPHEGWEEQFGYSMAEASLMELPVVSTTSGSIEEIILDGKTGILIEPGDKDSLRLAMLKLAKDEGLRSQMGKAGREYIKENFSYQTVAKNFYNFFKTILNFN